jgi:periplasmic protein TonB
MTTQQERTKKVKASLGTAGICVLVLLLMMLTSAWDTAQSGLGPGEYPGIEVNLGYDTQGSGNDQPMQPIGNENATDTENPPSQETKEPPVEEAAPAPVESNTTAKPVESNTLTDPKSDVEINEVKKEVKPAEKKVEKKVVDKPIETKPVEKPREVNKDAIYQPKKSGSTNTTGNGEGKQGTTGNEGDDIGKSGDKGVAGGTPGANVYTGKPGGGNKGTLNISGWNWDFEPTIEAPKNESGRIVFRIAVNSDGEVTEVVKEEGTVSLETEQACRREIQKLSFTKTGTNVPEISRGKITFVITSR